MKKLLLLISLISIFALSGCETVKDIAENHESKVRVGIALIIQGKTKDPQKWRERALTVDEEVEELKVFLDFESFTVTELKARLQKRIIEKGLDPARTIFYQEIVEYVGSQIDIDIATGLIKPESKVTVDKYLSIAEQAASLYL